MLFSRELHGYVYITGAEWNYIRQGGERLGGETSSPALHKGVIPEVSRERFSGTIQSEAMAAGREMEPVGMYLYFMTNRFFNSEAKGFLKSPHNLPLVSKMSNDRIVAKAKKYSFEFCSTNSCHR